MGTPEPSGVLCPASSRGDERRFESPEGAVRLRGGARRGSFVQWEGRRPTSGRRGFDSQRAQLVRATWRVRHPVRSPPSQGGQTGAAPVRATKSRWSTRQGRRLFTPEDGVRLPDAIPRPRQRIGPDATNVGAGGSTPLGGTAPASSGERAALIRPSRMVRFHPPVPACGADSSAPVWGRSRPR